MFLMKNHDKFGKSIMNNHDRSKQENFKDDFKIFKNNLKNLKITIIKYYKMN